MIYKYTKCESVIAKIMADANMSEKNIRITDMREWIFEAVEKIGAPMQYLQKESGTDNVPVLEIHDYQVPIPGDMTQLISVAYGETPTGPWIPARSNTAQFREPKYGPKHDHVTFSHSYDKNNLTIEDSDYAVTFHEFEGKGPVHHIPEQPMRYKLPTSQSQFYNGHSAKYLSHMIQDGTLMEPTFFIKPGWIVLSKKSGYVKLSYKAIAVDERGYPLIPDLASYQEAIYWYVMMKLSFPKFLNGSLGGHRRYNMQTYTYLQQQWNFYRNQAYAEAMMPTESDMRSIKNEWNKLIPDWDSDDNFFHSVGSRQLNYNDYYYGY